MRVTLKQFIDSLTTVEAPTGFRNPYTRPETVHNLRLFLSRRDSGLPTLLLIGEAPGYRGAFVSGVPLCSLDILVKDWDDPWKFFGPKRGFMVSDASPFWKEATATMIWDTLARTIPHYPIPLTWNAVPFHPFRDSPNSNASLREQDVAKGRRWLELILEMFPSAIPVALGQRADYALSQLGIEYHKLRHPSRGGKADFELGLLRLKEVLGKNSAWRAMHPLPHPIA